MGRKQKNTQQESLSREEMEHAILEHAAGLKEEMNLRLFCQGTEAAGTSQDSFLEDGILLELLRQAGKAALWKELCIPENILWVDNILITEIAWYHAGWEKKAKQTGLLSGLRRILSHIRNRVSVFLKARQRAAK